MSRSQRMRETKVCARLLLLQFVVLALVGTSPTRIKPPLLPSVIISRMVDGFLLGKNPTKILHTTRGSFSSRKSSKRITLELSVKKPVAQTMNDDENHHQHHHCGHRHRIKKETNVVRFKTFDEVLDRHHDETVLVCFEAFNCGPCRLMKKELEQLQELLKQEDEKTTKLTMMTMLKKMKNKDGGKEKEETEEVRVAATPTSPKPSSKTPPSTWASKSSLKIFRLDAERYPGVGVRYGIHRLPCLVFVKNHKVQLKLEGLTTAEDIYHGFKSLRP